MANIVYEVVGTQVSFSYKEDVRRKPWLGVHTYDICGAVPNGVVCQGVEAICEYAETYVAAHLRRDEREDAYIVDLVESCSIPFSFTDYQNPTILRGVVVWSRESQELVVRMTYPFPEEVPLPLIYSNDAGSWYWGDFFQLTREDEIHIPGEVTVRGLSNRMLPSLAPKKSLRQRACSVLEEIYSDRMMAGVDFSKLARELGTNYSKDPEED